MKLKKIDTREIVLYAVLGIAVFGLNFLNGSFAQGTAAVRQDGNTNTNMNSNAHGNMNANANSNTHPDNTNMGRVSYR